MIHIPKTGSSVVPVEVTLYDAAGQPKTGMSDDLTVRVYCMDSGTQLDFADSQFKSSEIISAAHDLTGLALRPHCYSHNLDVSGFKRGHFKAVVIQVDGPEWDVDFSVGLYSRFSLGFSVVYTPGSGGGTGLKLTLWVEEDGKIAPDIAQLQNVQILDRTGTVLGSGGNVGTVALTNGVGNVTVNVGLTENTQYVIAADAILPTVTGTRTAQVWVGIARP